MYTMKDYIKQSYNICLNNLKNYEILTKQLVELYNKKKPKNIYFVASGSSYNACISALPFMQLSIDSNINVFTPFSFMCLKTNFDKLDLILVVTQSGISTNAIEVLRKLKSQNVVTVCITGNINSEIKEVSDIVIDYGVGEELVGYVTKGVTTLTLFLILFGINLSKKFHYLKDVEVAISCLKEVINKSEHFVEKHFKPFSSMYCCYCCGIGNSYGVALEGSLKIGETIHIPSITYEVEEYIHGPNLQLTPKYTVLFFDSNDSASERIKQIYNATKTVTDNTFIITSNKVFKNDFNALYIDKNYLPEFSSFIQLPFIQLISYFVNSSLNSSKQHPLLKEFKKVVSAKTSSFINYDNDD